MKTRKISIILIGVLISLSSYLRSQQEPMNAQYVMNKLFINPAYAGYKESTNFVAMHRSQWIGFKGAPMTQVLTFDMPLKKNEFAMGATLLHDRIGPSTRIGLSIDFAYRARLSNRATLAFGLKGSAELYQANLTDLTLASDYYGLNDEAFMTNTEGLIIPNAGFGVYYYMRDHFIGLSIPRMIRPELERRGSVAFDLLDGRHEPQIHLMAGKLWKINRQIKFQPNVILRSVTNAPVSLSIFSNVILMDQFTVGVFYGIKENIGALFQWQVDKSLRFGYSVDLPANRLIRTNFGSHEITVGYAIPSKRKRIVYPRYF